MSNIVYGLFDDRSRAEAAIAAVSEAHPGNPVNAVVHERYIHDEEIQLGFTDTLLYAAASAGFAGVVAFVSSMFVLGPALGVDIGTVEALFFALACGPMYGALAGAVAGASECRPNFRAFERQLETGKVLVTFETETRLENLPTEFHTGRAA